MDKSKFLKILRKLGKLSRVYQLIIGQLVFYEPGLG
jgi:hypothetical protein